MTDLTAVTWCLKRHAVLWLRVEDLEAVRSWMKANEVFRATAERPIVVCDGEIHYGEDLSWLAVVPSERTIVDEVTPLLTAPPEVWQPELTDEQWSAVSDVLAKHVFVGVLGTICATCSETEVDASGRRCVGREGRVLAWPCEPVVGVWADVGIPVPEELRDQDTRVADAWNCNLSPQLRRRLYGRR